MKPGYDAGGVEHVSGGAVAAGAAVVACCCGGLAGKREGRATLLGEKEIDS